MSAIQLENINILNI